MKNIFPQIIQAYRKGKSSYIAQIRCQGKKTLDIGCGFGEFLKYDKERFVGIEINETAMIEGIKRGCQIIKASAEKVPFEDASFERIVAIQVIEHMTPETAYVMFQEVVRLLKPEGEFILSTEMNTKTFWNTFSHIKPYPPKSILKFLREDEDGLETFSKTKHLQPIAIYYSGKYFRNNLLNILSQLSANYLTIGRKNYTMIIKKI